MARWFGSSGIRGAYGDLVSADLALRLGRAAGARRASLIVGHDARLTSPLLANAFVAGALSSGAQVAAAGGVATPSLAYAARRYEAGVVITASHNPPPDNGFKFWNPDGSAWSADQENAFEAALEGDAPPRAPWDQVQAPEARTDVSHDHRAALLRFAGTGRGHAIVDVGNGAGAWITPSLLAQAGYDVETLHAAPDGRFPNRPSEPTAENLAALRDRCRHRSAWGVAHDGDADRMVAVAPDGVVVAPDVVLVALALHLGARRIVTPVDASLALRRALPQAAWEVSRVGDAAVSAQLRAGGGDLGGETSGTYVVPGFDYAPDGPLAALLFLRAAHEGRVDEARRLLVPVHRVSDRLPLEASRRAAFLAALAKVSVLEPETAARVDGLRVDTAQGWFLVRPSGTEPVARVTAEAWTPADARRLLDRARALAADLLRTEAAPSPRGR